MQERRKEAAVLHSDLIWCKEVHKNKGNRQKLIQTRRGSEQQRLWSDDGVFCPMCIMTWRPQGWMAAPTAPTGRLSKRQLTGWGNAAQVGLQPKHTDQPPHVRLATCSAWPW